MNQTIIHNQTDIPNKLETVRNRIKLYKAMTDTSYVQIAKEVGINKCILNRLTCSKYRMTEQNLNKLAAYLDSKEF